MQPFRADPMLPKNASVMPRVRTSSQRQTSQGVATSATDQDLQQAARLLARLRLDETQSSGIHQTLGNILAALQERPAVLGCMLLKIGDQKSLRIASHTLATSKLDVDAISKWLLPKAAESLVSKLPTLAASPGEGIECIAMPVGTQTVTNTQGIAMIVTVLQAPLSMNRRAIEIGVAQTVSAFLESVAQKDRLHEMSKQVNITATTLELIQRVQRAATVEEVCLQIVAELKEHFCCDKVYMGLTHGQETCKLNAVSGIAHPDPNAEATMLMKAVLDESVGRGEVGSWPPLPGNGVHRLLAHKQIAGTDRFVISAPLTTGDGEIAGALVITGRREMAATPNLQYLVEAISEPLAETITLVSRNQGSAVRRKIKKMMAKKHAVKRYLVAAAFCILTGILFCPWTYTIRCQSVAEPVQRRFCVAPHDGILQTTMAEPGDMVQIGQPLAQMDGREILWDLAGVTAERHRAEKKRDTHLANQETPEALMADLEARTLENKQALLEFHESNLTMTSPIEGVVLSGSLDRRENYPVTKGQVLYEVAPLDQLRVEVGLPADEVMHVHAGDIVELYFDGFGMETVSGAINKIRPRAEIRGQENVFVAEVLIENPDREFRPGMNGIAKVQTGERMIAWIVFHHATEKLFAALPW